MIFPRFRLGWCCLLRLNFCLFLFAVAVGCSPSLNDQRSVSLEIGEIKTIAIAPINAAQTVKVTANSPGAPIDVHVYLAEHEDAVEQDITFGKEAADALAVAKQTEQASLTAEIPAGKEAMVRLYPSGGAPASVELHITN